MAHSSSRSNVFRLGLLFVAAVLIPGVVLSLIAIRAAGREEAWMEKQLETTLLSEVTFTATRLNEALADIRTRLDSLAAPFTARTDSLIGVPFVFSRAGAFEYPLDRPSTPPSEREFLSLNADFFMDRRPVEMYRTITDDFAKDMLKTKDESRVASKNSADISTDPLSKLAQNQALSLFDQDAGVQKEVYAKAQEKGRQIAKRSVVAKKSSAGAKGERPQSMYVTESLRFSQIIADNTSGLIPRIIDDRMMLLYWRKSSDSRVDGCVVDMQQIKTRLIESLPQIATRARVLTVLDHNGAPIAAPAESFRRDWRRAFVAREIGSLLPRWEVAAYLSDPGSLAARARTARITLGLLVGTLFVSIAIGGFVVLKTINAELRLAQQKTTFVANVSHELKTPLTSIRLFAELLRDGRQADAAKQKKYLDIMVSETERLTRLINNVLDFARMNRGARTNGKRRIDLVALCRELLEGQQVRLEHNGFSVQAQWDAENLWVNADPEAIKQAFVNVLGNAEKYSSDEKWISVRVGADNGSAVIVTSDRGAGVPASERENIFREFYRVDDSLTSAVRGTGLGLAITRRILRDHGGDIRCEPNEPRGSRFVMTLPCAGDKEV